MGKLFGTDGIRGIAGESPLSLSDVFRLGLSAGTVLRQHYPHEKIRVIGVRDTRASGARILNELSRGLRAVGIDFYDAGVISTPSAAHLTIAHRFHSGVVISASHNPPEFNGIKFFNSHDRRVGD